MTDNGPLRGQLIEEETLITLDELCGACTVRTQEVVTLVREGVIDPVDGPLRAEEATAWRFHITSVRRVRTVVRLQRDLGVNLAGAALALELLDRIAELERRAG
ncbi:MAG: chaperone modulator CbpM [Xanthomonadales bacterium]